LDEPKGNILLVDDQEANLLALEAILAPLGQHLVKGRSGEEALRHLLAADFAAVLLDIQMQGLDGFETARLIRGRPRSAHTPIIFLTAHETPDFPAVKAYALGAVDYLVKPLVPEILRAKVDVFVKLYQRTEQVRHLEAVRLADEAQRTGQRRFQAIIEHSWDVIALLARNATVRYASPATSRMLGYTAEEFVGRNVFELMHPDDVPRTTDLFRRLIASAGSTRTALFQFRHKDGSWRLIEGTGTNLLAEPSVQAIVCHYRDVTAHFREINERKKAEREREALLVRDRQWLEAVVDLMPMPVLFLEPGTARVTFANRAANEMAGGEFPKGKPAEEYHTIYYCTDAEGVRIPDDHMPGVRVARGERLDAFEMDWHLPAGPRSLLVYADTLPAMHGHPAICVALFQDIRRVKEVEAALRQANQAKDQFLAMLAHELRNPLAPILGGLHLLRQPATTPAVREQTRNMLERQFRHLARLIDDLLEVSGLLRGTVELHRERLDLGQLTSTAAGDRRGVLSQTGLALRLHVPEIPVWVAADETRLTQVISNLLDNAVKFSAGRGTVTVRLSTDPARRQAVLSVRDEGIGIAPEVLPRLFTAFAQAEQGLERSRGGLGLGLALAKGLTELHGGEITVASEGLGRGAEFTVRLLLQEEPAPLSAAPARRYPPDRLLRILIVEDNRDAADSLRLLLELRGHEVQVAFTGPEGVQAATAWEPDVILCDIGLPGLDGYGVARQLRRHPATAGVRLLALTGYGREEDKRRTREAGFDHHLVKPADPEELLRLLASG
jgi:PAS domain S-box-containing protein